MEKEVRIFIRVQKYRKENWKKICVKKQISLTNLIIDSVENRILDNERRKILVFLEKQDNLFTKIETNINQVARIVNTQKFISKQDLKNFNEELKTIIELKQQQNEIFKKIYSLTVHLFLTNILLSVSLELLRMK
jgi:hypothetical protein